MAELADKLITEVALFRIKGDRSSVACNMAYEITEDFKRDGWLPPEKVKEVREIISNYCAKDCSALDVDGIEIDCDCEIKQALTILKEAEHE